MADNLKLFFSMVSGELYFLGEDEIKNVDNAQIPMLKKPNSNCKQCYGRFHVGFETKKKYYIPCPKCKNKCVDWDALKDVVVETPQTINEVAEQDFTDAIEDIK